MKTKFNGFLTLLLAFVVQISFAQQKTISGTVSDKSGSLPGVSVYIKGTTTGTETDFDGKYSIKVNKGATLSFSYLGYKTVEKVVGNSNTINVTLAEDANVLDEIVVVGYGTSTKKSFTGTATVVDQAQLEIKNFSNVSQALTGEVAGVTVINTSGQPGSVGTIRIRGYGSINGNSDPLYVVDGVPFLGNVNSINPADIKSTTILKDATATAIYGSRGANGVVLITTKSGSSDKSSITVDLRTSINDLWLSQYDVVESPEEYIGYVWEGIRNKARIDGNTDPNGFANATLFTDNNVPAGYNMWNVNSGADLIDPATSSVREGVTRKYTPLRYRDVSFNPAIRTEANVRMSGGNENSTYYASFGYLDDNGFSLNTGYKRYSTRLNLNSKIKPWLNLTSNIGYTYSERIENGQIAGSENVFEFANKMAPIFPVFLRDNNAQLVPDPFYGGFQYDYGALSGFRPRPNANGLNPIGSALYDFDGTDRHEFNGNFAAKFTFTEHLTGEIRYGVNYATQENKDYTNKFYGGGVPTSGDITINDFTGLTENIQQLIRYQNSWGIHSFDALLGHESNSFTRTFSSASKGLQVSPFIYDLDNFQSSLGLPSGSTDIDAIESYFSQFNYNYDGKYYLYGSVRTDGSSRFVNDKWGTFYSIGASWLPTSEDFLSNNDVLKYLKIKASYGTSGEQRSVGRFSGFNTFTAGNLDGGISLAVANFGNPDLTWENSKQFQTGIEFTLGDYLDGSLDYYNKTTDGLIFDRFVGPSRGISSITVNDGALVNAGLEFNLTGHLIKKENFTLDLNINGEFLRNEVTQTPIEPATGIQQYLVTNGNFAYSKGKSVYDYYMREWAGVDPADGAPMWYQYYDDVNNNGVLDAGEPSSSSDASWVPTDATLQNGSGSIVEYQAIVPGANIKKRVTKTYGDAADVFTGFSRIPDIRGAFRLSSTIHDFTISTQFTYSLGGYAYDGQYAELLSDRFGAAGNNFHKDIQNRWRQPGDITNFPRLADGTDQLATSQSTRFITSTDYLALNNVNISYNLPSKYLGQTFDAVNVSLTGDNLFAATARRGFLPFTRVDGDTDRRFFPPMSTLTLGVRVRF
ncbi:SusC/RagA family TonB-linked outer membrane protein [Polaribacter aestuariivivens]|uniref:SusC/RagA family TonB-linked outer membrane protein n=1 Tax=Polaribacter aestuariivivens TaxID=2304626 RepID=A0A5S3N2E1_9FLAO|nr:SusC/RagA family TonB-linked outer membrane protein [Polaribacter aestuariivivens]TMM29491.1 SusC/RagA family TonB-linked outer membrane protein [Polaribacter aestuariivivens]